MKEYQKTLHWSGGQVYNLIELGKFNTRYQGKQQPGRAPSHAVYDSNEDTHHEI
jgi:hypothetical protein